MKVEPRSDIILSNAIRHIFVLTINLVRAARPAACVVHPTLYKLTNRLRLRVDHVVF